MIEHTELAAHKASIVRAFRDTQARVRQRQAMTEEEQVADTVPPPPPTLPAPPDKHCLCGATYDYFDWVRLPYVGVMEDAVDTLTLRNCSCGSTIAVEGLR